MQVSSPITLMPSQVPGTLLVALSCVFATSCDSPTPKKNSTPSPAQVQLGEIDIQPMILPDVPDEQVPGTDKTRQSLLKHLGKHKQWVYKKDPQAPYQLRLRFVSRSQPAPSETRLVMLGWQCVLVTNPATDKPLPKAQGKMAQHIVPAAKQKVAQPIGQTPMVESLHGAMHTATQLCVDSLAKQWTVLHTADDDLGVLISSALPNEAAVLVLTRVRDKSLKQHVKSVRALLNHQDPRVVLMALGVLVQFKDVEADAQMVEATARLSHQNHVPAYTAALYQIGTLNAPEGRRYLQTLIDSHNNKHYSTIAREALKPTP